MLSFWTECSSASHPSRKTACVFKNPDNAGMVGKISFQAKSYIFNLLEMFENSGSGENESCRRGRGVLREHGLGAGDEFSEWAVEVECIVEEEEERTMSCGKKGRSIEGQARSTSCGRKDMGE